jgi:hypothetical protein
MAHARTEVADLLRPALPAGWIVDDHPHTIDGLEPDRPVVMLASGRVRPGPALSLRANELRAWLVEPTTDPGGADDALDDLLVLLLAALDTVPLLEWPEAERGVYGDQEYPAYLVTINVNTTKE